MRSGYGIYGRDDVYLLETSLIHYGWKSGEIFFRGSPISKMIDSITLESYAESLLGGFSEKFLSILYEKGFDEDVYEKLAIINSYNGFSPLHFTYIVLRANGYGLYRTLDVVLNMGGDYICRSLWYYNAFKAGVSPSICPYKRDAYLGGKLPIWMDVNRRLVYGYVKRVFPDLLDEFKVFDRSVRSFVKEQGSICCEFYTMYLVELDGRYSLLDVVVRPKFLVAEALYRELRESGVDVVVVPPLYRGELLHSPSGDVFKEESKEYD